MRIKRALRWYPPAWRERYGEEFAALLADTVETDGGGVLLWLSVVRGGLAARAEWSGLVGRVAGAETRARMGIVTAFCGEATFAFAVLVGWHYYPSWPGFLGGASLAADLAGVGILIALGVVAVVTGIVASRRWVGRQSVGGAAPTSVARPLVALVVALAIAGAAFGFHQYQDFGPVGSGEAVPAPLAGVATYWAVELMVAAIGGVGVVKIVRRAPIGMRALRWLSRLAAAMEAGMAVVVMTAVVWAFLLHRVWNTERHGGVAGTPLWSTAAAVGLIMAIGFGLTTAGVGRARRAAWEDSGS